MMLTTPRVLSRWLKMRKSQKGKAAPTRKAQMTTRAGWRR